MQSLRILLLVVALSVPPFAAAPGQWSINPKPFLDVAPVATNGDVVFERPTAGARLSNGSIMVADAGAGSLVLLDSTGHVLRRLGRRGNGPNEFQSIWWLGQCAVDSVFVWDLMLKRMSLVTVDGAIRSQFPFPGGSYTAASPHKIACSRASIFAFQPLATTGSPSTTGNSALRGAAQVFIVQKDVIKSLGNFSGDEIVVMGGGGGPRPLGKQTSLAVIRDRVYVGTADSAFVDVLSLDGRRLAGVPLSINRRRPSDRNYLSAVDEMLITVPAQVRSMVKERLLSIPMPEQLPPYKTIIADSENLLWLLLSFPGDSETRLQAVNEDGKIIADLRIPLELTVFEIGSDYLLGSYEDSSSEPHVALFFMRRGH